MLTLINIYFNFFLKSLSTLFVGTPGTFSHIHDIVNLYACFWKTLFKECPTRTNVDICQSNCYTMIGMSPENILRELFNTDMDKPDNVIPNCMIITNIKNGITVLKINVDRVFARSIG